MVDNFTFHAFHNIEGRSRRTLGDCISLPHDRSSNIGRTEMPLLTCPLSYFRGVFSVQWDHPLTQACLDTPSGQAVCQNLKTPMNTNFILERCLLCIRKPLPEENIQHYLKNKHFKDSMTFLLSMNHKPCLHEIDKQNGRNIAGLASHAKAERMRKKYFRPLHWTSGDASSRQWRSTHQEK